MEKLRKPKLATILMAFILSLSLLTIALSTTVGQEPLRFEPVPYINAMPNPVQVNNPLLFHVGSVYPTPTQMGGWSGLTVEVTDPQGNTETLGPIQTDTTGGTGVLYTPTRLGTYTARTHFPEQVLTTASGYIGPAGTIMIESYSEELEFVVQDDPIAFYPGHSLPNEYWSRPIDQQIREWYTISANWLGYVPPTNPDPHSINAKYNDYAPESAHILWTKPLTMGGLAGGTSLWQGFEQGDAYEGKFGSGGLFGAAGPVIIGGILFYNQFEGIGTNAEQWVNAIDMHTGEMLWSKPLLTPAGSNLRLAFGQTFYWDSYNYHGVFDFLWATESPGFGQPQTWHAFDPFTGRWVYSMEGMPSGTKIYGPKGEIFLYNLNKNAGTLTLWNSSRVVSSQGSWRPQGQTYDAEDTAAGIEWTITIPGLADLPGNAYKYRQEVILGADFTRGGPAPNPAHMWAISVDIQNGDAELMWDTTWSIPNGVALISVEDVNVEEDLFIVSTKETRTTYGFRLSTGQEIWGPTPSRHYTDNWGHSSGNSWDIITEGKVIAGNYGGTVWCYNAQTGTVEWSFDIADPYTEVLHNNRWRFRPVFVAGGKLYIENTEHNPRDPQPRGAPFISIDLETGEQVFRVPIRGSEWGSTPIIADSIIAMYDNYDQRIYAIGKGPSAMTVRVSPEITTQGSSVMVTGTVLDVSPGTESAAVKLRFPNGVPAISDQDMSDWMMYVYDQFAPPADATGVPVKIEIVDPNGHYEWIGTATTDVYGNYGYSFKPQIEGKYMIITTFEGSASYYGSTSTTYFAVDQAPTPAIPIEPEEPETPEAPIEPTEPEAPLITTEIAIVIAVTVVAVIGVAAYWMLKRK
ncbi:MAG: PQQ-binding-like beta-propeller repeat protein [Candidatus Bathyarchaeum tardum]|nr:MAG: PQQ-binding-like beta-propeller repeat protein [Candidatus Bathyarchaeum tardum]